MSPGGERVRLAREAGFVFVRKARGSHEVWEHPENGQRLVVVRGKADCRRAMGNFRRALKHAAEGRATR